MAKDKTYEKKGRDAIIAAVQDQALLKTNWIKYITD